MTKRTWSATSFLALTMVMVMLLTPIGCAPAATPTPVVNPSKVEQIIREHAVTLSAVQEYVISLVLRRARDTKWRERPSSVSTYGIVSLAGRNMLTVMNELAEKATLRQEVQVELEAEKVRLSELLSQIQDEKQQLDALGIERQAFSLFYESAISALELEAQAIQELMTFYLSEDFVRKGSGADQFAIELENTPARLQHADVLWMGARLQFASAKQTMR